MSPLWFYLGGIAVHALAWQIAEVQIQEYGEAAAALITGKPLNQTARKDSQGIPMQLYRDQGLQYNPLFVAARAKRIFSQVKKDPAHAEFLRLTDWLLEHSQEKGDLLLFPYHFDVAAIDLHAPWLSCLAQAVALTCFAQRSTLNKEKHWIADCSRILKSLSSDAGLGERLGPNSIWFPEYETLPKVLNGMMAVLLELHATWRLTGLEEAKSLFDAGYKALIALLPEFDRKGFSLYSLDGSKASRNYHKMHIRQLRDLCAIQPNPVLSKYRRRWLLHDQIPVALQLFSNPRPKRIIAFWGSLALILLLIWAIT